MHLPPVAAGRVITNVCPAQMGKQAIRKFLLRHRNQKPNTQEGEKHHKPASVGQAGPKATGPGAQSATN